MERQPIGELLSAGVPVLMEGAVVERVRRGAPALLDPLLMNAPLVYDEAGRDLNGDAVRFLQAIRSAVGDQGRFLLLLGGQQPGAAAPRW